MTDIVTAVTSPFRFAQISQMVTAVFIRTKVKDLSWKQTICFLGGSAVTLYLVYSWFLPAESEDKLGKAHTDCPSVRRRLYSRRTFSSTKSLARTFTSTCNLGVPYPNLSSESEEEEDVVFSADPNYIPSYVSFPKKKTNKMKTITFASDVVKNENGLRSVENKSDEGGIGCYEIVEKKGDQQGFASFESVNNKSYQGFTTKPEKDKPVFANENKDDDKDPHYPRSKNTLENLRERYQRGELPSTLKSCLADQKTTDRKKSVTF
jgi:hypothetical protein